MLSHPTHCDLIQRGIPVKAPTQFVGPWSTIIYKARIERKRHQWRKSPEVTLRTPATTSFFYSLSVNAVQTYSTSLLSFRTSRPWFRSGLGPISWLQPRTKPVLKSTETLPSFQQQNYVVVSCSSPFAGFSGHRLQLSFPISHLDSKTMRSKLFLSKRINKTPTSASMLPASTTVEAVGISAKTYVKTNILGFFG